MRRYNVWGGNPEGDAEDATRCVAQVTTNDRAAHSYQCRRPRCAGEGGLLCKQHAKKLAEGVYLHIPSDRSEQERVDDAERAMVKREAELAKAREQLMNAYNETTRQAWTGVLADYGHKVDRLARARAMLRKEQAAKVALDSAPLPS